MGQAHMTAVLCLSRVSGGRGYLEVLPEPVSLLAEPGLLPVCATSVGQ